MSPRPVPDGAIYPSFPPLRPAIVTAAGCSVHHIDSVEEYRTQRGRLEVEAESVAYVVAGLCGFDTSAYSIGYIAGWSNEDVAVICDTAVRVLAAAHSIMGMLDP